MSRGDQLPAAVGKAGERLAQHSVPLGGSRSCFAVGVCSFGKDLSVQHRARRLWLLWHTDPTELPAGRDCQPVGKRGRMAGFAQVAHDLEPDCLAGVVGGRLNRSAGVSLDRASHAR
jgi:hypothetical protein